jgi:hypothetical protein
VPDAHPRSQAVIAKAEGLPPTARPGGNADRATKSDMPHLACLYADPVIQSLLTGDSII